MRPWWFWGGGLLFSLSPLVEVCGWLPRDLFGPRFFALPLESLGMRGCAGSSCVEALGAALFPLGTG